jgi:8-oxo-dGTP diphosphatase
VSVYVAGFAFAPSFCRVLLVRKNRPAWQAGRLNAVGGKVEPGETPDAAMAREFVEETAIQAPLAWEPLLTLTTVPVGGHTPDTVHFYRGQVDADLLAAAVTAPPTDEPLELHDPVALPGDVIPNLRWLVPLAGHTHDRYLPFDIAEETA